MAGREVAGDGVTSTVQPPPEYETVHSLVEWERTVNSNGAVEGDRVRALALNSLWAQKRGQLVWDYSHDPIITGQQPGPARLRPRVHGLDGDGATARVCAWVTIADEGSSDPGMTKLHLSGRSDSTEYTYVHDIVHDTLDPHASRVEFDAPFLVDQTLEYEDLELTIELPPDEKMLVEVYGLSITYVRTDLELPAGEYGGIIAPLEVPQYGYSLPLSSARCRDEHWMASALYRGRVGNVQTVMRPNHAFSSHAFVATPPADVHEIRFRVDIAGALGSIRIANERGAVLLAAPSGWRDAVLPVTPLVPTRVTITRSVVGNRAVASLAAYWPDSTRPGG